MQVSVPYLVDGVEHVERLVARRAPNGRTARLLTIPRSVQGLSVHDLVAFSASRDGRPARALEVVARSPLLTVHLHGPAAHLEALRTRLGPVTQHPGAVSALASGHLAAAIAPHLLGVVLEHATATSPGSGRDDRRHRAGRWTWNVSSRPSWPSPMALPADPTDLAAADELAVWAPTDEIGRAWDARFVAELRQRAAIDRDVREALRGRRYLVAVVPVLRDVLARTYGPIRAGGRTFPLGAADPDAAHRAWLGAHEDGRVRWCPDRHVDRDLRAMLVALGLDPDADPQLVTDRVTSSRPQVAGARDLVGGGQA